MEATPAQTAEGRALCRVLAHVLERLVQANGPLARADPGQVTRFHAMKAPGIGVGPYLERIHKYASCSNECFVLALIYIDRLIQRSNFLLTELNVHRVVITSVLLAAKFFDDAYYNNAYYAKVGGVLTSELNGLEIDFLFRINFSLHVPPEVFEKYRDELLMHSSVVNQAPTSAAMPPILEASPQTVPMPPCDRIPRHGAHCHSGAQTLVTPSPPTPDYRHQLPPDYHDYGVAAAAAHAYDVHGQNQQLQLQQRHHPHPARGYHHPLEHAPQHHHLYLPVDVASHHHPGLVNGHVTPSYFPQQVLVETTAVTDYARPSPMHPHHLHHPSYTAVGGAVAPPQQVASHPHTWNGAAAAMLGVSGAGL